MMGPSAFEDARAAFLESLRTRGYSAATRSSYGEALGVFFRFLGTLAVGDLRAVTYETARHYQAYLSAQGWTTWTVHARLQGLKRFFDYLEAVGAVLVNPCERLVLPPVGDRLPRVVLTRAEARKILDAPDTRTPKGIRDRAILELFYSTGLRLAEMAALNVHDIDSAGGFVRVIEGKFAKDRVTPMGGQAADYLREYLSCVRAVWSAADKDQPALWLSTRAPHPPIGKQVIQVMVRDYGRAAGIGKPVTPHVWRHTCATHLVGNGAHIAHAQRLLGHASLTTTQRYARVTIPEAQATARKRHPRARAKAAAAAPDLITTRR
jgi:integrase/recombinase XerD